MEGEHRLPPPDNLVSAASAQSQSCRAAAVVWRKRRPIQREYDESQYYDETDLEQDVTMCGSAPSVTSDDLRELIIQLSSPDKKDFA